MKFRRIQKFKKLCLSFSNNVLVLHVKENWIYFLNFLIICVTPLKCECRYLNYLEVGMNDCLVFLLLKKLVRSLEKKKIYITGLGFKMYVRKNRLYLLLGYSHYILVPIPRKIAMFVFKKRGYVFSATRVELSNFMFLLGMLKKFNFYKHKGLFQFKQIKSVVRFKVGKKQQYR